MLHCPSACTSPIMTGFAVWRFGSIVAPLGNESLVLERIDGLEIAPSRQMSNERFGVDAGEFFFSHRKGDHRNVGRFHALIAQLLIERHVSVAADG
jgi:hypothetical protein